MKGAAVVNLLLTTLQTVNLLTPATPSVTLAGRYLSTRLHSERTCIIILLRHSPRVVNYCCC